MKNTKWIYKSKKNILKIDNINTEILQILNNRDICSQDEILNFLNPSLNNLRDPFTLEDMAKAVTRILLAIENKEHIWIYGDYDVDGITSTSLSYLALKSLGAHVEYYIPLRDEGYGLNKEALTFIQESGGTLIITVDCGITSHNEIDHCNSLGMDIIITDHHDIIDNKIPNAFAIINPKREENLYSFKNLAGVGTVFNLFLAVFTYLSKKEEMFKYLDIVALGTIADIVPLVEDNRIFVKYGLESLKKSSSKGLSALLKVLFFENYDNKIYTPYDVGFVIAPVFNAAGRLEDAKSSVELLISNDHTKFNLLIPTLIENNQKRKEIQEQILKKSLEEITLKNLENKNLILIANKDFHHGVIGIVASKILDQYYKPTIVMEIDEKTNIAKGSCRSTESFNIIAALTHFSHHLLKFGGHHAAAGFSIKVENLEKFYNELDFYCGSLLNETDTFKPVKIEKNIGLFKVGYDLIENLTALEPYGFGNPTPIFSIQEASYSGLRQIGKDKNHLMINLIQNNIEIKNCVWFGAGESLEQLEKFSKIDIAFKLKMETYKDRLQYKIFIEDIRETEKNLLITPYNSLVENLKTEIIFPIKTVIYTRKKIENDSFKVDLNDSLGVILLNREKIGTLDSQVTFLLKTIGGNFSAFADKNIETSENFNIFISIIPDYSFKTYAINDGTLFQDIKLFLIGKTEYSVLQKTILSTIFKEKSNYTLKAPLTSEIEIIALTIAIYCSHKKIKFILTSTVPISNQLNHFSQIGNINSKNISFHIKITENTIVFENNIFQ